MDLPCHYKPSIWGTPIYGNLHICSCKTNICPLFLNPSLVSPGEKKSTKTMVCTSKILQNKSLKHPLKPCKSLKILGNHPPFLRKNPWFFKAPSMTLRHLTPQPAGTADFGLIWDDLGSFLDDFKLIWDLFSWGFLEDFGRIGRILRDYGEILKLILEHVRGAGAFPSGGDIN